MFENIYKGSKKKFVITLDGLSTMHLTDDDIDFTVEFSVKDKYAQGTCEVAKSDCTFVYATGETDSNTFHCVCDTTNLPLGRLITTIVITYPDADTGDTLQETVLLTPTNVPQIVDNH